MVRIGAGPIAAGLAAFAVGSISYMWLTLDVGLANAGWRAGARHMSAFRTIDPQLVRFGSDAGDGSGTLVTRTHLASLETGDESIALEAPSTPSEPASPGSSFNERFSFDRPSAPARSLQRSLPSASFNDRFTGELSRPPVRSAVALPLPSIPPIATAVPLRITQPAEVQVLPKPRPDSVVRRAGTSAPVALAYAPSDPANDPAGLGPALKNATPSDADPLAGLDASHTAIYDITSRTVYLPNGQRLEAHSGLGRHMDDPRYVHARGTGPTPPNVYTLRLRESLFHGVRAIRLIPADNSKMYGRNGILAHSYMLGPSGQSNGCVSFSNYSAFLDAFLRGDINRLVVVEHLAKAPSPKTASDWLSDTLKDIFRRS